MEKFRFDPESHAYYLGSVRIPSVTQIISGVGLISDFARNDAAAERGTLVHLALALFGANKLDFSTVDERIMGWVLSGVRFYESMKFKPVVLETPDYHPDYLYGYTFDGIGSSSMGDILIDWKTGKKTRATALQLAAYLDPVQRRWGGKWKRLAVELDEYGGEPNLAYPASDQRTDFADFLACRRVYDLLGGR